MPPAVAPKPQIVFDSEAFGLLNSVGDGLYDLIAKVAEMSALRRSRPDERGIVEIEPDDIRRAAATIVSLTHERVSSGELPAELATPLIEELGLTRGHAGRQGSE